MTIETTKLDNYTQKCMLQFIYEHITQNSAATSKTECAEQSIFKNEILACDKSLTYENDCNAGYDTAFINTKTKMLYTRVFSIDLKDIYLNNEDILKLFIQKLA